MNINSRLFDRIRIVGSDSEPAEEDLQPRCDHPGCRRAGEFRAPQGRGREGQFFLFCLEHVKDYNAHYNYFAGMNDDAVQAYQKDALVGHRPTWKLGANAKAARVGGRGRGGEAPESDIGDPFGLFGARRSAAGAAPAEPRLGVVARKALEKLGLDETADSAAIKARYKELVKRLHPDANGGDRSREETLREILKAYQQLKSTGLV